MTNSFRPEIRFLQSAPGGLRPFDKSFLHSQMPLDRQHGKKQTAPAISYGEYFQAVERFITNQPGPFLEAISRLAVSDNPQINRIDIIAEKHGGDYHPAHVKAYLNGAIVEFAVNVAVGSRGQSQIQGEFLLLKELQEIGKGAFIPQVYYWGQEAVVTVGGNASQVSMFLAEWFQGYHEFHLSAVDGPDHPVMVMWNMDGENEIIPQWQTQEIYRQAAYILTYYYDMENFSEIFPWHHAAGDFVASCSERSVDVRLVTIRHYAPRISFDGISDENMTQALLLFLVNLTIRMRLDRLDGIGETVWADHYCLIATIQGFLDAVRAKEAERQCSDGFRDEFILLCKGLSPRDWVYLFKTVLDSYHELAPDIQVIQENLADHILNIYKTMQAL